MRKAAPYIFLAMLFAAFHHEVVFSGKVYYNKWIFRNHAPFPRPEAAQLNPLNPSTEYMTAYFPYKHYLKAALREKTLPLWNPYVFCGFPLLANGNTCVFSPFNLFLLLAEPYRAYVAVLALFFMAGAFLTYYFLKKHLDLSTPASLAGAVALLLCPHLIQFVDYDTMLSFIWAFPLALIAAERLARDARWVAIAPLFFLLSIVAGHVHGTVNALILFTLYFFWAAPRQRTLFKDVSAYAAVILLFLGVSFFILWPTADFFRQSHWLPELNGGGLGAQFPLSPLTAVYPAMNKVPLFYKFLGKMTGDKVSFGSAVLVGTLPFLMGLVSCFLLFSKSTGRKVKPFAFLIFSYHIYTIVPFTALVPGALGQFLNVAFFKYWQLYAFSCFVVTAYAFDALFSDALWTTVTRRLTKALFFILVLPTTVAAAAFYFFREPLRARLFSLLEQKGLSAPDPYYQRRFAELFQSAYDVLSIDSVWMLLPPLLFAVLLVVLSKTTRQLNGNQRGALKGILLLVLTAELFIVGRNFVTVPVSAADVWPTTQTTDFLEKDKSLFRVMALQTTGKPGEGVQKYILKPNLSVPYRLYDVGGMDSITSGRYLYFTQKYLTGRLETPFSRYGQLDFEWVNAPVASLLNVKYVLVSDHRLIEEPGFEPVLKAEGLVVYENKNVLPRVFFTRKVRRFTDFDAVFQGVTEQPFSHEPWVYADTEEALSSPASSEALAELQLLEFKPDNVKVALKTPEKGMLVFTDSYDRGWKVFDNGRPATLERVDGLFKGVSLNAGAHEIQFTYRPQTLYQGLAVSLVTLLSMIVFLVLSGRFRVN